MPIEFPIVDLLSSQSSVGWLVEYVHPQGFACPRCGAGHEQARFFRKRSESEVEDYGYRVCDKTYSVYSGTVFEGRRVRPAQVVQVVRGIVKGGQAQILANEVGGCRQPLQRKHPLAADEQTETDELYQNAGGGKVNRILTQGRTSRTRE